MAAVTSYDTLVQNIKDALEDDGLEFANYIPTAIALAEKRLIKELDLLDLEIKSTGTLTTGTTTIAKPTGYRFANFFRIIVGSNIRNLLKKREDFINDYWPNENNTDAPKYYCDDSSTTFKLAPTPDSNYAYTLKYTKSPDVLSETNQNNYFTDETPEILYAATLVEMARFMKAWDQVTTWESMYQQAAGPWNLEQARKRRDDLVLPLMPDTGPNTIKHTMNSNA